MRSIKVSLSQNGRFEVKWQRNRYVLGFPVRVDGRNSVKSRLVVVSATVEINLHTHKCEEENSLLYCSTPSVLSALAPVSLVRFVASTAK